MSAAPVVAAGRGPSAPAAGPSGTPAPLSAPPSATPPAPLLHRFQRHNRSPVIQAIICNLPQEGGQGGDTNFVSLTTAELRDVCSRIRHMLGPEQRAELDALEVRCGIAAPRASNPVAAPTPSPAASQPTPQARPSPVAAPTPPQQSSIPTISFAAPYTAVVRAVITLGPRDAAGNPLPMTLAQFAEIYARLRYTLSGDDLRELEELERRVALAGPAGGVFSGNVSAAAQNPAASTPQNPVLRPLQQAAGAALPPNILHHLVHNAERLRAGMGPGLVAANANPAAQNSAATMPQNLGQLPSLLAGARTPHGGQQPSQAAVRPPNSAQQPLQAGGGSAPGTLPRRFYGTANAAVQNPAASTPQPRPEDTTTGGTAPNANTPPPNPSPPTPLNRAQRTSQSASKSRVRRRVEVEQSDDEMDGIERDRALPTPKRAKGKKTEAQLAAEKAAKAEQRKRDREERERLKEEQKKRELIAKHGEEGYARLLEANRKRRETLEVKRRAKEAEEEKKTKELAKEMTKEMEQREKQLARELERVKNEAEEAKTRAAALERARAAAPLASTPATTAAATAESETASPIPATLDEEELANVANVIRLGFPAETVRAVAQDLAAKWKRVTAELLVDVLTSGVPDEEPEEPKPQPPSQQQEDPSCVICLDNPPTHALIPCGHRVLCDDCIGLRLEECPICRTARQGVLRIFL